ncbi:hypothetical protein MMC08_005014, partial [Hypocenomyce scalaris]|nr:hypothetical protein [Hypocenomyce scalaris]
MSPRKTGPTAELEPYKDLFFLWYYTKHHKLEQVVLMFSIIGVHATTSRWESRRRYWNQEWGLTKPRHGGPAFIPDKAEVVADAIEHASYLSALQTTHEGTLKNPSDLPTDEGNQSFGEPAIQDYPLQSPPESLLASVASSQERELCHQCVASLCWRCTPRLHDLESKLALTSSNTYGAQDNVPSMQK